MHFNAQLNTAIGLLEHIENRTEPSTLSNQTSLPKGDDVDLTASTLSSLESDTHISLLTTKSANTAKFREAVLPLIKAGESISLVALGEEMTRFLYTGSGSTAVIRNELVEILWREGWEMDMSIPGVSATGTLPNIDTDMVALAVRTSIRFDVINTREEAIAKTFGSTYDWILQPKPREKDGKPLWENFPKWLADNSNTVYWITGKPGSGKSTMMKFLLQQQLLRDYLSKDLGTLKLLVVKYYAWNAGQDLQKSLEGLKKTLVSQALEFDPELTPKLAPRRWVLCQVLRGISGLPTWESWEIDEAFKVLLSQCGKTIKLALFIDGLDEFDVPPKDIIHQIREITALCPTGLKICVASRPWNTFSDEFSQGPALEMHQLTHKDMITFVAGSFRENRAFVEHQSLNPEAASQLVANVVERSNGVFQWVSLVVPLLLDLLTDGESPTQSVDIQQALQDLPSELETLYETIWARIPRENLHNASFMIQIMRAAEGPITWLTMWVIEELKSVSARAQSSLTTELSSETIKQFHGDGNLKKVALMSLKRKLVGRTKGILELNLEGDGFVDFIHRTARDWAKNPETWRRICNASKETFDPYLYLLEADTLTLPYRGSTWTDSQGQLRDAVLSAFWHASKIESKSENDEKIIKCLESLEEKSRGLGGEDPAKGRSCWAPARFDAENTFLGLAAQFSILPYIESALLSDHGRRCQKHPKGSLGLLENAIFGPLYYNPPVVSRRGPHPIPRDRRLETVKYLLKHGVYQSKVHTKGGVRDLKDELERTPSTDPEFEYYAAVLVCLNEMGKLTQMKLTFTSASDRLRYRVGFLIGRD